MDVHTAVTDVNTDFGAKVVSASAVPAGNPHVTSSLPTTTGRNAASGLVPTSNARTQWAVRGAISNVNAEFERLRPDLAHSFPFELDGFQKEAVIHLEQVCSIQKQHMDNDHIREC